MLTIAKSIAASLKPTELEALATLAEAEHRNGIPQLDAVQSLLRLRVLEISPQTHSVQLTVLGRLVAAEAKMPHKCSPKLFARMLKRCLPRIDVRRTNHKKSVISFRSTHLQKRN